MIANIWNKDSIIDGVKLCDAHAHFGPDLQTGEITTIETLEKYIKRFHIEKMLAFASDGEIDRVNDQLIQTSKIHKEIYALMRLTPKNIDWCRKSLPKLINDKIVGIKYHPSIDKVRVTDPLFSDVFAMLNDLGAIALIHTGRWVDMASYEFGLEIAKKYPKLRVILAHMGGNELHLAKAAIEHAVKIKNIWFDTSNCRIPNIIKWAERDLGSEHILLGSDIPWGTMSANLATVIEGLEGKDSSIHNIIYRNLAKMLS